jgi:ATP-binding cassette subfamily B protein
MKLLKYLKPYLPQILLVIVLLFVQANADLALPDYLSRIVNNGIQQGGITSPTPEAIRASQLERLSLFMSEADAARLKANFTLQTPAEADADLVSQYPLLATEPIYTLNALTADEQAWMDTTFTNASLALAGVEKLLADPAKAAAVASQMGFDLSKIPAGTDFFQVIGALPAAQRQAMVSRISAAVQGQVETLGEGMSKQAAIALVRTEYDALGMNTTQLQQGYILRVGGLMLLITLLSAACMISVSFIAARVAAGFARDTRSRVFSRVESFSNREFDHFSTASLITRTTNDITQVQMVVMMMLRMVFYAPIMGVGGIIRAINKDSSMWWVIAVAVGMLLSLIVVLFTLALPKFKKMQSLIDRLNLVMRENLSGMMVIRAFNRQSFEEERFDRANQDLTGNTLFVTRLMASMFPIMTIIMNGVSVLIIWIGAHQVAEARMLVGDMIAFLQYAMQIVFSFLMMSMMFIFLPRASVSADRIAEVIEMEPEIKDPAAPVSFPENFKGTVEFRNVSFHYPGAEENVICSINFTARPGETTAIIGSTGSGKSTVVNLIPRFYDVTEGEILVSGVDVRTVTQHDLREKIGYIPQKSVLFSGTIATNLLYADENAPDSVLEEAIQTSQAAEFVASEPDGMEKEISQGGANVSGGQKQRLSIARALVKRAPIYIFDDSFSALDFKTDAALRRALRERAHASQSPATLIIVTQRVSTIRHAEQIIVLDEGSMVGRGTHEELMKTCETYREIALSQLSQEELA